MVADLCHTEATNRNNSVPDRAAFGINLISSIFPRSSPALLRTRLLSSAVVNHTFLLCMAHPFSYQRCNCLTSKERRLYAESSFGAPVGFFHHCCVIDAEKGDRWLHVALDSNFGSLTRYAATIGHDPQPAGTIIELIDSFT